MIPIFHPYSILLVTGIICLAFVVKLALINHRLFFKYVIYYIISLAASIQSYLLDRQLSQIIISIFLGYDLIFFLWELKKFKLLIRKKKEIIFTIITSLCILILTLIIFHTNEKITGIFSIYNSIVIIIFSFQILVKIFKNNDIKEEITESQFWLISAFYLCSIASIWADMLMLFFSLQIESYVLMISVFFFITWAVKYSLLLKSAICLRQSIHLA